VSACRHVSMSLPVCLRVGVLGTAGRPEVVDADQVHLIDALHTVMD
jgi:hypothetical protein